MKLYYFNPNNYGQQYFVCAESKQDAIDYLLKYLKKKSLDENECYREIYNETFECFKKAYVDKSIELEYTIEEHDVGDVVQTEIC